KPATTVAPASPLLADEIWDRTLAAYREAKTYRDNGSVRLTYKQSGEPVESTGEVSVRFARPNKIRINAYHVQLSCDEQNLRAKITDESSNNMDGQFVERPTRGALSMEELFDDELLHAQVSTSVIRSDLLPEPLQLEFLLSEKPLSVLGAP